MFIRRKTKEKILLSVFILSAISLAGMNIAVYLLSSFPSTKAASSITLTSKYNSSDNSVSLEWEAASDEANNLGFRIIRSEWETPEYPDTRGGDQVEPVGSDKTSYIWTGVPRGMVYYFRICQLIDTLTCVYSNSEKIDTGASSLSIGFTNPVKDAVIEGNLNVETKVSFPATKAYLYISQGTTSVGFYRDDSYNLVDSYYYFNFTIDSQNYDDGKYMLTAVAYKTDSQRTTTTLDIIIDNNIEAVEPSLLNINVSFKNPPNNISETVNINVESSVPALVYFSVYVGSNLISPPSIGQDLGSGLYGFLFDTNYFNDGQYTIKARAVKEGYNEGTATITVTVLKAQEMIVPAIVEPEIINTTPEIEESDVEENLSLKFLVLNNTVLADEENMQIELNKPVDSVNFAIIGSRSQEYVGAMGDDNVYSFLWQTTEFEDGKYKLIARAYQNNEVVIQEYIDLEIKNNKEIKEEAEIAEEEIVEDVLLPICREQGVLSAEECRDYILLPHECREIGLTKISSCKNYLNIDEECRQRGIGEDDCPGYLSIPKVCREARINERGPCEKYIFNKAITDACGSKNVTSQKECSEDLLSKQLPQICKAANINNASKCWEHYKEKEGDSNIYCKNLGLSETAQCQRYLNIRHVDLACIALSLNDQKSCNQHLFIKNSSGICLEAGIVETDECKAYIFNKYVNSILCEDNEPWACVNRVYRENIGALATRQSDYQIIRKLMNNNKLLNFSLSLLKSKLITGSNVIGLANSGLNIKLLPAKETLVADNSGLLQTGPALILLDSDLDNIPDGIEGHIGTNPNDQDTDDDGLDDYAEIISSSNPNGQGAFNVNNLSAVIKALMRDNTWEHPLTMGQVDERYTIQSIKNIATSSATMVYGYQISGQAEANSLVVLYIYSAIPIVTFVETDNSGSFIYEFPYLLKDGEHEAFVTQNDSTGKVIKKSQPYSLFIKDTQAVSLDSYLSGFNDEEKTAVDHMMRVYVVFAGVIIVVAMAVFTLLLILMKNK